jgi:hypothetical protein
MLPPPIIHAGFTALAALSAPNEQGAALGVEICLGQVQGLADPKATAPQDDEQAAYPLTVNAAAGVAHDCHDLLNSRWIGG